MLFVSKTYDFDTTQVIDRQNKKIALPAPFVATQPQYAPSSLIGKGRDATLLNFSKDVTGRLIETEGFGSGKVGQYWNNNNAGGDTTLRSVLCAEARDFTLFGNAQLHAYPWASNGPNGERPDPYGPDAPQVADGLCMEGASLIAKNLRLAYIAGTALVMRGGTGSQDNAFSVFDFGLPTIDDVEIAQALYGARIEIGDAKAHRLNISGIVKDGLTWESAGGVLVDSHIEGADRGAVINTQIKGLGLYHEAARIGTIFRNAAHGSEISVLDIGPGTCWENGVRNECNGVRIGGLCGTVRRTDLVHSSVTGYSMAPGLVHSSIQGQFEVQPNADLDGSGNPIPVGAGAIAFEVGGHRNKFDLRGGWNGKAIATFAKAVDTFTQTTIEIRGLGDRGTVLDLSGTSLNNVDGKGNDIRIWWEDTATRVIYPGGGTVFNLHAGTELRINGVLQS